MVWEGLEGSKRAHEDLGGSRRVLVCLEDLLRSGRYKTGLTDLHWSRRVQEGFCGSGRAQEGLEGSGRVWRVREGIMDLH